VETIDREDIHSRLVVGLKTRAVNYLLVWPVAMGLAWAYTAYTIPWFLYLATGVLAILFVRVCIPNVAYIVTLNTKFYGGLDRSLRLNVPIAYFGATVVLYAVLALWRDWPLPVIAIVAGFYCATSNGRQGGDN
jgi:hypothetical protein